VAVSLVVSGMPEGQLQFDRGERQLDRLLEVLAVAHPRSATPLSEALALEAIRLARNSAVIVITASTDLNWPEGVHYLLRSGVRPVIVSLDPSSFAEGQPENGRVLETLVALGVPALSVRRGDDLVAVLQQGSLVSAPRAG
jgi:uncharacterized protein (DUF58 family)